MTINAATSAILQVLAERDSTLELEVNPRRRRQHDVPEGQWVYELEVIFDGALDECFDVQTNKIGAVVQAISEDVSREYSESECTLGWSVEARLYVGGADDHGRLSIPMGAEPVVSERVAPKL